jgi:hypothetical protein
MGSKNSRLLENKELKQEHIDLVKSSWSSIEDKYKLGMDTMIRNLTKNHHIKHVWIFASNLTTEEEMLNNSQLKYHTKKFVDVLANIIDKIEGEGTFDERYEFLENLGRSHFHYGVKEEYFQVNKNKASFLIKLTIKNKTFHFILKVFP